MGRAGPDDDDIERPHPQSTLRRQLLAANATRQEHGGGGGGKVNIPRPSNKDHAQRLPQVSVNGYGSASGQPEQEPRLDKSSQQSTTTATTTTTLKQAPVPRHHHHHVPHNTHRRNGPQQDPQPPPQYGLYKNAQYPPRQQQPPPPPQQQQYDDDDMDRKLPATPTATSTASTTTTALFSRLARVPSVSGNATSSLPPPRVKTPPQPATAAARASQSSSSCSSNSKSMLLSVNNEIPLPNKRRRVKETGPAAAAPAGMDGMDPMKKNGGDDDDDKTVVVLNHRKHKNLNSHLSIPSKVNDDDNVNNKNNNVNSNLKDAPILIDEQPREPSSREEFDHSIASQQQQHPQSEMTTMMTMTRTRKPMDKARPEVVAWHQHIPRHQEAKLPGGRGRRARRRLWKRDHNNNSRQSSTRNNEQRASMQHIGHLLEGEEAKRQAATVANMTPTTTTAASLSSSSVVASSQQAATVTNMTMTTAAGAAAAAPLSSSSMFASSSFDRQKPPELIQGESPQPSILYRAPLQQRSNDPVPGTHMQPQATVVVDDDMVKLPRPLSAVLVDKQDQWLEKQQQQQQQHENAATTWGGGEATNVYYENHDGYNNDGLGDGFSRGPPTRQGCACVGLCFLLVVGLVVGIPVGLLMRGSEDTNKEPTCGLCYGAPPPANLPNQPFVVWSSNLVGSDSGASTTTMTCADLLQANQRQQMGNDLACRAGQAIAWQYCGCPSLPPPPPNNDTTTMPTAPCLLCNYSVPSNLFPRMECQQQAQFVSTVGSWMPDQCPHLVNQTTERLMLKASSSTSSTNLTMCSCPSERFVSFAEIVADIVSDPAELVNPSSPRYQALQWLVSEDPARMDPNDAALRTLIQDRFLVALLYLATNGPQWNLTITDPTRRFLSSGSVCNWNDLASNGVACDNEKRVTGLLFDGINMRGTIPAELGFLTTLTFVHCSENSLTGSIPSSVGRLTNLEQFFVGGNRLTGTLPDAIFGINSLTDLRFDRNQIGGSLPLSMGELSSLRGTHNQLTGTIPASAGQSLFLQSFEVGHNNLQGTLPDFSSSRIQSWMVNNNNLTGTIPMSLTMSQLLTNLVVSHNGLSGQLPPFVGQGGRLRELRIDHNANINGSLVDMVSTLPPTLRVLSTTNSGISGSLPSTIGTFTALTSLSLGDGRLSGDVPTEIGLLPRLEFLYLNGNNLVGTVPTEIGQLGALQVMDLADNQIGGPIPSTIGNCVRLSSLHTSRSLISGRFENLVDALPPSLEILDMNGGMLSGVVPSTITRLSNLRMLSLMGNVIGESLPTEIGALTGLENLVLRMNQLSHCLPSELGLLTALTNARLSLNRFNGTLPQDLAGLTKLAALDIAENQLSGSPTVLSQIVSLEMLWMFGNRFEDIGGVCNGNRSFTLLAANDCNIIKGTLACACCTHCCHEGGSSCPANGGRALSMSERLSEAKSLYQSGNCL